ncbi:MAG: hypothetical protein M9892_04495 [Bacteroidetes bacterium]|nr:hypothetical protein [Bacteroidota bacterium]
MKSYTITTAQIIAFNTFLNRYGLDEDVKRGLIYNYTNGRTTSTKEMLFVEAKEMLQDLNKQAGTQAQVKQGGNQPQIKSAEKEHDRANQMRRKVIAIAYQLGWTKPNGKIDMDRLNMFIASRPIADYPIKQLNDIKYNDLPKLINQFEQLLTKHLNQFKRK